MKYAIASLLLGSLFSCAGPSTDPDLGDENIVTGALAPRNAAAAGEPAPANPTETPPRPLIGEEIALAEWRKAENRDACAPLALVSDAGGDGTPRRAQFGRGWAVAFDRPELRSAYGLAGTGLLPEDRAPQAERIARLERQWPYFRRFEAGENLPAGSVAGYGLEGARPYADAKPDGRGQNSLAYLRIPGQACQYNIWSRLGRGHLEALLTNLRIVEKAAP